MTEFICTHKTQQIEHLKYKYWVHNQKIFSLIKHLFKSSIVHYDQNRSLSLFTHKKILFDSWLTRHKFKWLPIKNFQTKRPIKCFCSTQRTQIYFSFSLQYTMTFLNQFCYAQQCSSYFRVTLRTLKQYLNGQNQIHDYWTMLCSHLM